MTKYVDCICKTCGINFQKKKSEVKKTINHFCSRSCAAIYNNTKYPKRQPEGTCIDCNKSLPSCRKRCDNCNKKIQEKRLKEKLLIKEIIEEENKNNGCQKINCCGICGSKINHRSSKCYSCYIKLINEDMNEQTIEDVEYTRYHKSSAYSKIRTRARSLASKLGWSKCANCNYDKHIEICHITPISDFPKETKIKVVNSIDNLIPLCPNCHWEFDHGVLNLEEIKLSL